MNVRRGRVMTALAAAVAAVLLGVGLWIAAPSSPRQASPPLEVPGSYRLVRTSAGHAMHVASGEMACRDCHELGAGDSGFAVVRMAECTSCHRDRQDELHARATGNPACLGCHDFRADPAVRPVGCMRCHDRAQGHSRPVGLHKNIACDSCHRVHDEVALVPRRCEDQGCHPTVAMRHGRQSGMSDDCLTCHEIHDPDDHASEHCASCHARAKPVVDGADLGAGHRCASCHRPHDFSRRGVAACASCHDTAVLASRRVAAHRSCDSCHPPHRTSIEMDETCVRCHAAVSDVAHPTAGGSVCAGCHPVHAPEGEVLAAVACTSCHSPGVADGDHHAPGVACEDCHRQHAFSEITSEPVLCARCHARTERRARGGGHAQCSLCHKTAAHAPGAPTPGCAGCHAGQASTAPAGHQMCADCHDPHRGRVGAEPSCRRCHADRARGVHAAVPGTCGACHAPHGPKSVAPPTCTSCHPAGGLPALHGLGEHRRCADCHRGHEDRPRGNRVTCLRCHEDQTDHEPQASSCVGCHPFAGSGVPSGTD